MGVETTWILVILAPTWKQGRRFLLLFTNQNSTNFQYGSYARIFTDGSSLKITITRHDTSVYR